MKTPDERWFASRDFDVEYEVADGSTWANLRRRSNPQALVARYGRGTSEEEAVASARKRWEVEQVA